MGGPPEGVAHHGAHAGAPLRLEGQHAAQQLLGLLQVRQLLQLRAPLRTRMGASCQAFIIRASRLCRVAARFMWTDALHSVCCSVALSALVSFRQSQIQI